jgi:hypothetical protein
MYARTISLLFVTLILSSFLLARFAQQSPVPRQSDASADALKKEFPLVVQVISSDSNEPLKISEADLLEDAKMGMAPPVMVFVKATINGQFHWFLSCQRENPIGEANPCSVLLPGAYPARWVHNGELLQLLVKDDKDQLQWRFFDVQPLPFSPPSPDNDALRTPRYQFQISDPRGRRAEDYPLLLHVYGAVSLRLPGRVLPGRTNCTAISYGAYGTNISCTNSGAIQLYQGRVYLKASIDGRGCANVYCDSKWRGSKCAALGPGFFLGRWKNARKRQVVVLVSIGGRPEEITFNAEDAEPSPLLSKPAPVRPPTP